MLMLVLVLVLVEVLRLGRVEEELHVGEAPARRRGCEFCGLVEVRPPWALRVPREACSPYRRVSALVVQVLARAARRLRCGGVVVDLRCSAVAVPARRAGLVSCAHRARAVQRSRRLAGRSEAIGGLPVLPRTGVGWGP